MIVSLMLASPPASQKQLSEALSIIAENDFPAQWESLLPVGTFSSHLYLDYSLKRHSRMTNAPFDNLGTHFHDSAQQPCGHERNSSDCPFHLQALPLHVQLKRDNAGAAACFGPIRRPILGDYSGLCFSSFLFFFLLSSLWLIASL